MPLSKEAETNVQSWLANDQLAEFHDEIKRLQREENWQELNDAFYTQIEFGTAGIRGKTGLGSARINSWTVGTAAQGLADYIKKAGDVNKGVVIGSDTRLTSPEFVELVTNILTANSIKIYRFKRPPQVGMFSFAVREYQAQAGIYISASHNPPTDNGLKMYWADGAQVLPPHDKGITEAVKAVTVVNKDYKLKAMSYKLVEEIGENFDTQYRARVLQESIYPNRSAKIVYSPFHGTGQWGVLPILRQAGFDVTTVDAQMAPDGNFPNIPGGVPNPQNRESNELTAQKVLETKADLGISTDPDADRLGLVISKGNETVILDGNETATLLAYFICSRLKEEGKLPANGFLVRTMVTTPILDAIAADFGLKIYNDLPVGFKFIGECINQHEDEGNERFIYGAEESFGSLKGSYARDKDAASAALVACELVSYLKDNNRTIWDYFEEIYAKYGHYVNELVDIKLEGAEGFGKMTKLMESLRAKPPSAIGSFRIVKTIDRQKEPTEGGYTANVLIYYSDDVSGVTVRPSGTEPKMKLYISLVNPQEGQVEELKTALKNLVDERTK